MDILGVLQEVLRREKGLEGLEVDHVENVPCVKPGDNYMSVVSVAGLTGSLPGGRPYSGSLFVKRSMGSEEHKQMFQTAESFSNEGVMYQKVIPLCDVTHLFPRCYHGDSDLILLEDLKSHGFHMGNRLNGFDLKSTKAVLQALAKFHAGTFNLYLSNKNKFTEIANLLKPVGLNVESNKDFLEGLFQQSVAPMEAIPGLEVVVSKLKGLQGKLFESQKEMKKPNKVTVLYHGDCWINNMLIKEVDQDISVKFVDLQASYLGTPMVDILTFFYSSINLTVLEDNFDQLLNHYCKSFIQQLNSLGTPSTKVPSVVELVQEFTEKELFGCVMGLMFCGAVSISSEEVGDINMDEMTKEKMMDIEFMKQFHTNAAKERVGRLLALCMKRGIFNR